MRKILKEARVAGGLTQQQMADKLEVCLRYYQKLAYAVESMAGKISRTALFLYTFKPHIVEEYL